MRYAGECSTVAAVKASVIQGSGLGPASLIITEADLPPTTPGNRIFKFADNTYLVVPVANSSSWLGEVFHPCIPGHLEIISGGTNKVKWAYLHSRKMWPVVPATTAVPEHWTCQLRQGPRHYTQWSTECDGWCKQLADVVQQFAVRDKSPPWSRHLDWVAPWRVSRHHPRQDHVLSPCMIWSLLSNRSCKIRLIS